jgi:preprotein translocase subunit Sss1
VEVLKLPDIGISKLWELSMAVKIRIIRSKPTRVAVTVRKPDWREFLSY